MWSNGFIHLPSPKVEGFVVFVHHPENKETKHHPENREQWATMCANYILLE
jgi:hypothetical protein